MPESIKEKLEDVGHKIGETATKMGHKVGEKAEEAADFVKEKTHQAGHRIEEATEKVKHKVVPLGESHGPTGSPADIREHMDVFGSCGNFVGKVDHVQGDQIKLTKNDSLDGKHHLIPLAWVAQVHDHIHLNRDCVSTRRDWESA